MTDEELMRLAAKAAGIDVRRLSDAWPDRFDDDQWNPLIDDGDALRLAVSMHLDVFQSRHFQEAQVGGSMPKTIFEPWAGDPCKATRRAIVRAAASTVEI